MNYLYDINQLKNYLEEVINLHASEDAREWIKKQLNRWDESQKPMHFNITFTAIPRFVDKTDVQLETADTALLEDIRKGFSVNGWSLDRIVRSWWLLQFPATDENQYVSQIENLFKAAEMNEQVALYGSLPLYAYPEHFRLRAAEGIRTNMGNVFEAVALDNPYPAEYLDEPAWNQMVLKAFFMDKDVNRIIGLDERVNAKLAHILSDYAHERWAAGRAVNPLLWRPVGKYIDEDIYPDIQQLVTSSKDTEKRAGFLACSESNYKPAQTLLEQHPDLKQQISEGKLTWSQITLQN